MAKSGDDDPTLEQMFERYMSGEAGLTAVEDNELAALAGLVCDLVAILHQVAPESSTWLLEARRGRLLALQRGERAPEMEGQAQVEELALGLLESVLRPRNSRLS